MRNILLFLVLVLAVPVFAQSPLDSPTDPLAAEVQKKVLDQDKIHVENLTVTNQGDGNILLEGVANLYGSRYKAGEIARKVSGVKKVDNEIAVTGSEVDDLDLQSNLMSKIARHLTSDPFDLISLKVQHGFVELSGEVRDGSLIDDAFDEVIWTPGVRDVKNNIQTASISGADDKLRQAIYTRLNAEYPQYFNAARPSIIILVNGGRVRLVGYVRSEVEKAKIASSIRSYFGVLSLDNQLQTE